MRSAPAPYGGNAARRGVGGAHHLSFHLQHLLQPLQRTEGGRVRSDPNLQFPEITVELDEQQIVGRARR